MDVEMKEQKWTKGSMTVEAALVLPILSILIMNLFSAIEIYRIHSSVAEALWQNGRISTRNMYVTTVSEEVIPELDIENIYETISHYMAPTVTKQKIVKELNKEPVWRKIVSWGNLGLIVENEVKDDILEISCSYSVHPLFPLWTLTTKHISNHYYGHAWTGYDIEKGFVTDNQAEEYVYITSNGTVFHKNRKCSYLNPSVKAVYCLQINDSRNLDGEKYEACTCCKETKGEMYYITNYGTNYHASLDCHGLKRSIQAIKITKTGGMSACSKCGG